MEELELPAEDKVKVAALKLLCKEALNRGSKSAKYIWGDWPVAYLEEGPESLNRLLKEATDDLERVKK